MKWNENGCNMSIRMILVEFILFNKHWYIAMCQALFKDL